MGTAVSSKDFGLQILKALGVDSHRVRAFSLDVRIGEPVTITIERIVDEPVDSTALDAAFQETQIGRKFRSETFELESRDAGAAEPSKTCCGGAG